jgi:hypothetical protein
VRTCKVPPTRRHAVFRGSAPSPITHYCQAILAPVRGPLSPFEVELFAARFLGTPSVSARSRLSPGRELPSTARLYEHCSPYPLDGFAPASLVTASLPSPWSGGGETRLFLVAHIRCEHRIDTSGLVSAWLPRVRPMSLRRTGRAPLDAPSTTSREQTPDFLRRESQTSGERPRDPYTAGEAVLPGATRSAKDNHERFGNHAPKPKLGPSRLRVR